MSQYRTLPRREQYQSKRLQGVNVSGILSFEGSLFSEEYQKDFLKRFKEEMNEWEASSPTLIFNCNK